MTKTIKNNIIILMMIATLVVQVNPDETTRKFNKLRKHIRLGLNTLRRSIGVPEYDKLVLEANVIWDSGKTALDKPEEFTVSLSLSMVILYDLLDKNHKGIWFTEKTFESAVRSLEDGYILDSTTEKSSTWLMDHFRDQLGIKVRKLNLFKG